MNTIRASDLPGQPYVRPGTSDWAIWNNVVVNNEYRLPEKMDEGAIVIDIGAHIGAFSWACMERGANVLAVEPDIGNFHLLKQNALGNITYRNEAVVSHYDVDKYPFYLSDYPQNESEINTGGAHVIQAEITEVGKLVRATNLISLIDFYPKNNIAIVKLDCEGMEFEALRTCILPNRVSSIIGEYHESDFGNTVEELIKLLKIRGFDNIDTFRHGNSNLGMFFARRV